MRFPLWQPIPRDSRPQCLYCVRCSRDVGCHSCQKTDLSASGLVLQLLSITPPQMEGSGQSEANTLRSIIVELFGRLPVRNDRLDSLGALDSLSAYALFIMQVAELPKPLIPQLMAACHAILTSDIEDNGMVAQRVLFDMHKTYKQALEEQSGPFFAWLHQVCLEPELQMATIPSCEFHLFATQLYANLPNEFSSKLGAQVPVAGQVPGVRSFKLASEVALMIVFLFQCHPRRLQEHAATLLPLMVKVIRR